MAGGSRGRGKRSANGAGTSRFANYEPLNDGSRRIDWNPPETRDDWALFGRSAYDFPITPLEWEEFNHAVEAYRTAHGGEYPPEYESNPGPDIAMSQVLPSKMSSACDKANEEIRELGRKWLHTMEVQEEKEESIADQKDLLEIMRREVMDKQREIKELEDEVIEIKDSYVGLEQQMKQKGGWVNSIRTIYPYG